MSSFAVASIPAREGSSMRRPAVSEQAELLPGDHNEGGEELYLGSKDETDTSNEFVHNLTLHDRPFSFVAGDREGVDEAGRNTIRSIGVDTHRRPGALSQSCSSVNTFHWGSTLECNHTEANLGSAKNPVMDVITSCTGSR